MGSDEIGRGTSRGTHGRRSSPAGASREALREKGMTTQSVWLMPEIRALLDQEIEAGRFKNRSEAINHALSTVYGGKERAMS